MHFPIGARAAGAKAVAEPDSDNEIAASLAVTQLQQGFMTGEMGLRGQVQGIISEPPMSLKGHSRRFTRVIEMSVLWCIAHLSLRSRQFGEVPNSQDLA